MMCENWEPSPDWHWSLAGGEGGMFSTLRRLSTVSRKARTRKKVSTLFKFILFLLPRWTNLLFFLPFSFDCQICPFVPHPSKMAFFSPIMRKNFSATTTWPRPPWHWVDRGAGVGHGHQRFCQVRRPNHTFLNPPALLNQPPTPYPHPIQPSFPSKLALPINLGLQELSKLQPTQLQVYQLSLANQPSPAMKKLYVQFYITIPFNNGSNWISTHRSASFSSKVWSNSKKVWPLLKLFIWL